MFYGMLILYAKLHADCLTIVPKNSTDKSALPAMRQAEIVHALATTATAVVALTAFVADDWKFAHGFYLLSYRRLSIDLVKKRAQRASALRFYLLITLTSVSVVEVSGANLIINCPQQIAMFSWFNE